MANSGKAPLALDALGCMQYAVCFGTGGAFGILSYATHLHVVLSFGE